MPEEVRNELQQQDSKGGRRLPRKSRPARGPMSTASVRTVDRAILRRVRQKAAPALERDEMAARSDYVRRLVKLVDANDIRVNCNLDHFSYIVEVRRERARSRAARRATA